jgi:hypothetical protein
LIETLNQATVVLSGVPITGARVSAPKPKSKGVWFVVRGCATAARGLAQTW